MEGIHQRTFLCSQISKIVFVEKKFRSTRCFCFAFWPFRGCIHERLVIRTNVVEFYNVIIIICIWMAILDPITWTTQRLDFDCNAVRFF